MEVNNIFLAKLRYDFCKHHISKMNKTNSIKSKTTHLLLLATLFCSQFICSGYSKDLPTHLKLFVKTEVVADQSDKNFKTNRLFKRKAELFYAPDISKGMATIKTSHCDSISRSITAKMKESSEKVNLFLPKYHRMKIKKTSPFSDEDISSLI